MAVTAVVLRQVKVKVTRSQMRSTLLKCTMLTRHRLCQKLKYWKCFFQRLSKVFEWGFHYYSIHFGIRSKARALHVTEHRKFCQHCKNTTVCLSCTLIHPVPGTFLSVGMQLCVKTPVSLSMVDLSGSGSIRWRLMGLRVRSRRQSRPENSHVAGLMFPDWGEIAFRWDSSMDADNGTDHPAAMPGSTFARFRSISYRYCACVRWYCLCLVWHTDMVSVHVLKLGHCLMQFSSTFLSVVFILRMVRCKFQDARTWLGFVFISFERLCLCIWHCSSFGRVTYASGFPMFTPGGWTLNEAQLKKRRTVCLWWGDLPDHWGPTWPRRASTRLHTNML